VIAANMQKDFDCWNKIKKAVNAADESGRVYFHEGDRWWAAILPALESWK
jgi:hypothetical protein